MLVNLIVFICTIIFFAVIASLAARQITSPKSFFHNENLKVNILSLTVANITLGTGFAYLLQGVEETGVLMFLVPGAVFGGYVLLAFFLKHFVRPDILREKNFLWGIDKRIAELHGSFHPVLGFALPVSISLMVVYCLALAYEIFASSKILSVLLFAQGSNYINEKTASILLSMIIFFIALIYALLGGINGVFRSDKFQLGAIVAFLVMLLIIVVLPEKKEYQSLPVFKATLKLETSIIIPIITAIIAAISTQFYSLLNWGYISHVEINKQARLLGYTGAFTAAILSLIVAIGCYNAANGSNETALSNLMASYSQLGLRFGVWSYVFSSIFIVGAASIVFSTIDSLIITLTMFGYDNIWRKFSKSDENNTRELTLIRGIACACFLFSFLLLCFFNFKQPNLFNLLLTITGGVTVFAPMCATAGYLSSKGNALKIFNTLVICGYLVLFGTAFLIGLLAVQFKWVIVMRLVGTVAFVASGVYSLVIISVATHSTEYEYLGAEKPVSYKRAFR